MVVYNTYDAIIIKCTLQTLSKQINNKNYPPIILMLSDRCLGFNL